MQFVNGRACTSASQKLKTGDTVEIELKDEESGLVPEEGEVTILHEDADVLVCAKEAGLTVHPCPSCPSNTLIGRLYSRYPELGAMGGLRPGIVHRLDKETSGLLVVARNERARLFLTKAFAQRRVRKIYLAIVAGKAPETGSCEMSIGRDPVPSPRADARQGQPSKDCGWHRTRALPLCAYTYTRAAPIRYACTWHIWGTRFLGMQPTHLPQ